MASQASEKQDGSTTNDKMIFAPSANEAGSAPQFSSAASLTRSSLSLSPTTQFHTWFNAASSSSVYMPETCCLATAALPSGAPSARFVYLKELDERGFVIYSNFGTSRKASDLDGNPQASLVFWWREVERQVRVEGRAERLDLSESQKYYDTRGRGSKLGAWASRQSQVLEPGTGTGGGSEGERKDDGRGQLDTWVKEQEQRFEDTPDNQIPCPPFWGGLRVIPSRVEFWQGRDSRLHDRFAYSQTNDGGWKIERLSP